MNIMELKFHNHINDVKSMMKRIKNKINQKNQTNNKSYCKQIVNDIIYNEKAHIVAIFKDYLIYDDTSEFLKRIYKLHETKCRLLKIFEFYDSYSKIFPNYTILTEAKYIYKNIQRKQKMIDNLQKKNNNKMLKIEKNNEDKIFVTDIYNSIMNLTVTSQKNEEINQNHQINFFQDKITKLDLNLSIKIDNSVQSFEGLIESIAKAEEKSVKPIKYIDNLKKVDPAREYKLNINTLLLNNANNTNLNKFNKKIDLTKQTLKTKTDLSPNMKINIPKETITSNKNYSHRDNTLFKSIQFNDKININNILENSSHMNLYKNKESFNTKASINEDKKTPQTDRINKNEISHKVTLSMPKLAANNHIYNNFNIINNFHAADPNANNNIVIPYSHINFVSELSPTTNSARVVHKIEIKKEEKIIKKEQILKNIKTNTSHSTNHNNNINKSNTDNNSNSNLIKLRKNHTKTNILRETVRVNSSNNFINNSTLKINLLKISSSLSQSNIPQKSQNSNILLMNTIKSPSNNEKSNSINLTKRDRAISLTARQFIRQDSKKETILKKIEFKDPLLKQIDLAGSPLIKSVETKSHNLKSTLTNNLVDRNKLYSSPKNRNSSESYKNSASKVSHIQYVNSKQISSQKSKNANYSINLEKRNEAKIRVNSAKNITLSPNKNLNTISTKSIIFKNDEIKKKVLKN